MMLETFVDVDKQFLLDCLVPMLGLGIKGNTMFYLYVLPQYSFSGNSSILAKLNKHFHLFLTSTVEIDQNVKVKYN